MNKQINSFLGMLVKIVIVIVVLSLLALVGLYIYLSLTEKQITSGPPPGYEDRVKYKVWNTGPSNPNIVPLDIWFGEHDGHYDTTHLRINSDYVREHPHYHGEAVKIMVVWPSMLSLQAYGKQQKQGGLPEDQNRKQFTIILSEAKPSGSGDKIATEPFHRCKPIKRDDMKGVMYCSKIWKNEDSIERRTHYLPIDDTLRTPWYKNSPNAHCKVIEQQGARRFDACYINFSYNADVDIDMLFVPEKLAIEIITDFTRLTNFLSTLEVKP